MKQPHVYIARPDGPDAYLDVIRQGLETCGLLDRIRAAGSIFIKPNLVTDNPEYIERGSNTDVGLIDALLQVLRAESKAVIRLGESDTGTAIKGRKLDRAVRGMGLDVLCQRHGVELVNMTLDRKVEVPIPRGRFLRSIELSETFWSSDLIINMPKMKTHKYAYITCALKNMFGAIPDPLRIVYHKDIHQTLADLNSVLFDRTLVVCDGLVAMEGAGPLWGTRKDMGLVLVAPDPLSCDRVVHQIMGFPRERVQHVLLAERAFGAEVGAEPVVDGLTIAEVRQRFEPAHKNWWIRTEEQLMRNRSVVRVVFNPAVQKRIIFPLRHVFARLRGGMYTWYVDDER
jgi:uncharacterized protein (DUF362 family)